LVNKLKIVFLFFLFPAILFAQPDNIQFEHLSVEDGLSSNTVISILQDSRGFMWFGTNNGLNRWDGYKFKIYTHNPVDSSSLSNDAISTLYEDTQGLMWVGTDYGLNKFNRDTENFTRYVFNNDSIDYPRQNVIWQIIEDNSGALWIATEYGLCRLDLATGKMERFIPDTENPKTLFNPNYVKSVCEIEKDRLLLGTRGGLISFEIKTGEFTKLPFNDPTVDSNPVIHKVYKDRAGTVWLGMSRRGLIQYNIENGESVRYKADPKDPSSLSHFIVWTIHEDRSGVLWVGTMGGLNKTLNFSCGNI